MCLCISLYANGESALALKIVALTFSTLGGSFAVAGLISLAFARKHRKKVERLMRYGTCYDGEIVRIYDNFYTRINYRHPFIVECVYKDSQGRSYLVKSGNIWPSHSAVSETGMSAKVWVDPHDAKDYFVDVRFASDKDASCIKYDYDYR